MTKHLKLDDLVIIGNCLNNDEKLVTTAQKVGISERGISKLIKTNVVLTCKNKKNRCGNFKICEVTNLCDNCFDKKCKFCSYHRCNNICENFNEHPACERVKKYPCCCNGCKNYKEKTCNMPKIVFDYNYTFKEREKLKVKSRSHIQFDEAELQQIRLTIEPLVKQGLSLRVIKSNHPELPSVTTLYKLINEELIGVKNIDLPRKVRFRKRKKYVPSNCTYEYRKGRYHEDFINWISTYSNSNVWELDTVEGIKGHSALMTLLHRQTNFMLIFKIENIDTSNIVNVFRMILEKLGPTRFKAYFSAILTDNGKEFRDPLAIENDPETSEKLVSVFYCDARQSQQKGKIEKNHELLRCILPKGSNYDNLSQDNVNLASMHINNYPRGKFNNALPLAFVRFILDDVILTPDLLKK